MQIKMQAKNKILNAIQMQNRMQKQSNPNYIQ